MTNKRLQCNFLALNSEDITIFNFTDNTTENFDLWFLITISVLQLNRMKSFALSLRTINSVFDNLCWYKTQFSLGCNHIVRIYKIIVLYRKIVISRKSYCIQCSLHLNKIRILTVTYRVFPGYIVLFPPNSNDLRYCLLIPTPNGNHSPCICQGRNIVNENVSVKYYHSKRYAGISTWVEQRMPLEPGESTEWGMSNCGTFFDKYGQI